MKCIVGYEATPQGLDALNLGIDLCRSFRMELHIVLVLRRHNVFSIEYPPTGSQEDILVGQATRWIEEAIRSVPEDIFVRGHVFSGSTSAEGLSRAAQELGASMIVVGGSSSSPFKKHRLGSIAQDLLFGERVPIALAPRGYTARGITRINCAVGTRPGAGSLVATGMGMARRTDLPLRLLALMGQSDTEDARTAAVDNARGVVWRVTDAAEAPPTFDIEVIAPTFGGVEWERGDIIFVGSSRVAEKKTVFAGSFAMHLLRATTVPLIVVPRDYEWGG